MWSCVKRSGVVGCLELNEMPSSLQHKEKTLFAVMCQMLLLSVFGDACKRLELFLSTTIFPFPFACTMI